MVLFQPPSTPPTPWEFGFYPSSQAIEVVRHQINHNLISNV